MPQTGQGVKVGAFHRSIHLVQNIADRCEEQLRKLAKPGRISADQAVENR